jgi:hypothetical protein
MTTDPSLNFQDLTPAHIKELCSLRTDAKMAAESFSEAIQAQAEQCGISRSALRKYICARVDDRLEALDTEANDLSHLLETAQ